MASTDKTTYTSFVDLGGRFVALDEVQAELERLPMDMVLGVLSRLSAQYIQEGNRFFHPRFQGELLAPAIVDDFPSVLPNAAKMYVPGRVPITGGKHLFIHEHNLCALAKLTLASAKAGCSTARLTTRDYGRVCRLLLIVNDHISRFPRYSRNDSANLRARREFAVETLYRGQFDLYQGEPLKAFAALARLRILLIRHMPSPHTLAALFRQRTDLDLEFYFEAAAFLLSCALATVSEIGPEQSPWMNFDWLHGLDNGERMRRLVRTFSRGATEVPGASGNPNQDFSDLFDFQALQTKPIIEARSGEFVVPVFSLLLRQLLTYPILVLRQEKGFLDALGLSYQDYAHSLAVRIAGGARPPMKVRASEQMVTGEIDSLLYADGVAVIMEHKAKQVVSTVGNINVARNALGPHDSELEVIAGKAKPNDKGGVTQPIWQFRALATTFEEHALRSWKLQATKVFPLVTLMEAYRIDEWVRRGYLDPLIEASEAPFPTSWSGIEWLHVSDLEALAELADRGELDLVALLSRKTLQPWKRFDIFIAEQSGGGVPLDRELWSQVEELRERMVAAFSITKSAGTPDSPPE